MTDKPTNEEGRYQLSPAEDDPEIIRLFGTITARWASLDAILSALLGKLLNNPIIADVIYYSLESFGARLDVITNLTVELVKEDHPSKKELVTLLNRVNRLSSVRNRIIHSGIIQIPETKQLMQHRRRPGQKKPEQLHPVKANDLLQHANALVIVGSDLLMIVHPSLSRRWRKLLRAIPRP
jgi:hypothetical protein